MSFDLTVLNEDSEFPCHDGDHHDYRLDDNRVVCRRGCGAELLAAELLVDLDE
ncbi:hypothetical protein [Nocardia sp. NPDC060249]|uniref:hypothetical protein n=1 Tax=Nocardia sp. NPDC060249 TaxID=3347082 RepID=UPI00364C1104